MVTDHRSAIRCRHRGPHGSWRLCWPASRFDGECVFLCRACVDLLTPVLRPLTVPEGEGKTACFPT